MRLCSRLAKPLFSDGKRHTALLQAVEQGLAIGQRCKMHLNQTFNFIFEVPLSGDVPCLQQASPSTAAPAPRMQHALGMQSLRAGAGGDMRIPCCIARPQQILGGHTGVAALSGLAQLLKSPLLLLSTSYS